MIKKINNVIIEIKIIWNMCVYVKISTISKKVRIWDRDVGQPLILQMTFQSVIYAKASRWDISILFHIVHLLLRVTYTCPGALYFHPKLGRPLARSILVFVYSEGKAVLQTEGNWVWRQLNPLSFKIVGVLVYVHINYGSFHRESNLCTFILRVHICDHTNHPIAYALSHKRVVRMHAWQLVINISDYLGS